SPPPFPHKPLSNLPIPRDRRLPPNNQPTRPRGSPIPKPHNVRTQILLIPLIQHTQQIIPLNGRKFPGIRYSYMGILLVDGNKLNASSKHLACGSTSGSGSGKSRSINVQIRKYIAIVNASDMPFARKSLAISGLATGMEGGDERLTTRRKSVHCIWTDG